MEAARPRHHSGRAVADKYTGMTWSASPYSLVVSLRFAWLIVASCSASTMATGRISHISCACTPLGLDLSFTCSSYLAVWCPSTEAFGITPLHFHVLPLGVLSIISTSPSFLAVCLRRLLAEFHTFFPLVCFWEYAEWRSVFVRCFSCKICSHCPHLEI